jgi:hypothetical protein
MPTRPATDEEVTLWYCEQCRHSGVVIVEPHADVYSVVNAIREAHTRAQPECDAWAGLTRAVRPNGWFNVVTDSASVRR